ncbi:pentraxin fusion protein [Scomber japonicus]|uniref:pentraxin fusion protein n=1 Tax=Scomber japonicus TaxID=13676 RepID=UPI0023067D0B|nr:pentraxin fusion protein [Scomber japonicus]
MTLNTKPGQHKDFREPITPCLDMYFTQVGKNHTRLDYQTGAMYLSLPLLPTSYLCCETSRSKQQQETLEGYINTVTNTIARKHYSYYSCLVTINYALSGSGLTDKVLVFPYETDFSFVALIPQKEMGLRAFTLCMRVATELPEERQIILFAYRTADYDELNVWREKDGRVSFYMSGDGTFFHLPPLTTFRTSLCLTWESRTGLAAFWVEGKRSTYQVYKPGHSIRPNGSIILGQDPDKHLGGLEAVQSFVGEVTDLNMWDFVLSRSMIQAWHYGHKVPKGNIFDWGTIEYELNGNVMVVDDD